MKVDVLSLEGKKVKTLDLPLQFGSVYRPNLIKRAVLSLLGSLRQRYGAYPYAGLMGSTKLSRRRRDYKGAYNHGISRVPRKTMWRRGMQFGWEGAEVPGTKGGRRAHPPKGCKDFSLKINKKERKKAIRSALSGAVKSLLIVDVRVEDLNKTKDVIGVLNKVGFKSEVERCKIKKIRAGKGKVRGRKYRIKKGPLVVVSKRCNLLKSLCNVQGFDVCRVNDLNVRLLTLGHEGVRKVMFSEGAIDRMKKEKLFM